MQSFVFCSLHGPLWLPKPCCCLCVPPVSFLHLTLYLHCAPLTYPCMFHAGLLISKWKRWGRSLDSGVILHYLCLTVAPPFSRETWLIILLFLVIFELKPSQYIFLMCPVSGTVSLWLRKETRRVQL